jgi:RNase P subunit RPR2
MTVSSAELTQKSILHLQAAAETFLPTIQPLSSHLWQTLLATADDNDLKLPTSYIDTHVCQRCGIMYIPGVTCHVQTNQSRRQRRKAKTFVWLSYRCLICSETFKTEVESPGKQPAAPGKDENVGVGAVKVDEDIAGKVKKRRKRDKLQGLRSAIEKSKIEKTEIKLNLQDLMKVD